MEFVPDRVPRRPHGGGDHLPRRSRRRDPRLCRPAGVAIPRDTYEQWAALPHIASSAIQPGDLLYYDGVGHVAIYVGDGYIIDAPQTGMDVEKIPIDTGWYASAFVGAARP